MMSLTNVKRSGALLRERERLKCAFFTEAELDRRAPERVLQLVSCLIRTSTEASNIR